jgi:hypothetical protein
MELKTLTISLYEREKDHLRRLKRVLIGAFKRGEAPSFFFFPFSWQGKGIQGIGSDSEREPGLNKIKLTISRMNRYI